MNKIENEFVTYEIASAVKELGFDDLCLGYFNEKKQFRFSDCSIDVRTLPFYYRNSKASFWLSSIFSSKSKKMNICTAPLWSQVIDWFREKHKLYISIEPDITFCSYTQLCVGFVRWEKLRIGAVISWLRLIKRKAKYEALNKRIKKRKGWK